MDRARFENLEFGNFEAVRAYASRGVCPTPLSEALVLVLLALPPKVVLPLSHEIAFVLNALSFSR